MNDQDIKNKMALAESVQKACIDAALKGYEDASIQGLCCEGAWEMAVDSMRNLDIDKFIRIINKLRNQQDER